MLQRRRTTYRGRRMLNICRIQNTPITRLKLRAYILLILILNKRFELISNAPDGFKSPFVRHALKLFAKALYVYVDGS